MAKKLNHNAVLVKAEEAYLRAYGWRKVNSKLWTPPQRIGYVFEGDKLFRDYAPAAQKQAAEFSPR